MADLLSEIVSRTRERVQAQKLRLPSEELRKQIQKLPPAHSFSKALHQANAIAVIAELKQASPSAGVIRLEDDLIGRVQGYARGGASALSILTEEHYFRGSPQILVLARSNSRLPILRKDFIIDPYQIEESRRIGADALLLIARLLSGSQLSEFLVKTHESGLEALVEIHDEQDLQQAVDARATIVGINHRDLKTLKIDLSISKRLLPLIPKQIETRIIESGIKEPGELLAYQGRGVSAALIGEALMRQRDPESGRTVVCRSGTHPGQKNGMIKIKICGITNSQDALWAANLGAEYIGLNFYPQSPRKISPKNAKEIVGQVPPFVRSVGVFVNEDIATIAKIIKTTRIKIVQLHGQETPEICEAVKALGVEVIKVISLTEPLNPETLLPFNGKVDHFLLDTHSSDAPGGTGQTFDWTWLEKAAEIGKQWFLAGGLTPDNVVEAIHVAHPPAVDVCSGVERLPTRKDYEAMKRFIQAVRTLK